MPTGKERIRVDESITNEMEELRMPRKSSGDERILSLETENALLHLKLAKVHQLYRDSIEQCTVYKLRANDLVDAAHWLEQETKVLRKDNGELRHSVRDMAAELYKDIGYIHQQADMYRQLVDDHNNNTAGLRQKVLDLELSVHEMTERYMKEKRKRKNLHNALMELRGNIRVHCRIRPLLEMDGKGNQSTGNVVQRFDDENIVVRADRQNKYFDFERVYCPEEGQSAVFDEVQPLITSALDGYNVCIMAYGPTGSGKSYTMIGADPVTHRNVGGESRAVKPSRGLNQSRGPNASRDLNQSRGVNASRGQNQSRSLNASRDLNQSRGVNASRDLNQSRGVNASRDLNQSRGVNASRDLNQSRGLDQSRLGAESTESRRCHGDGIIPRAAKELFRLIADRPSSRHQLSVSVMEIYNNEIRDLLSDDVTAKHELVQGPDGRMECNSLQTRPVSNVEELLRHVRLGLWSRSQSATKKHDHSSRSHLVVTIEIHMTPAGSSPPLSFCRPTLHSTPIKPSHGRSTSVSLTSSLRDVHVAAPDCDDGTIRTKLHLVDLAGSECVGKSGVSGEGLREAAHINKSLSSLSIVLIALAEQSSHVPYRNSRLTHYLQDSIGGEAKMLLLLCVSPSRQSLSESLNCLNFGHRARQVERGPIAKRGHAEPQAKRSAPNTPRHKP